MSGLKNDWDWFKQKIHADDLKVQKLRIRRDKRTKPPRTQNQNLSGIRNILEKRKI